MASESPTAAIARHLSPGARVAVADGAGMPVSLMAPLAEAAASVGGVSLVLGWCLAEPEGLSGADFDDVRTVMAGFGLRSCIDAGTVQYVPTRLRAVPALLTGPLLPDVLLVSWRRGVEGTWSWGTEVSWMQSVVDAGVTVLIESNDALPRATSAPHQSADRGTVIVEVERAPLEYRTPAVDDVAQVIAGHVLPWVPEGRALQYGPSAISDALLGMLDRPVHLRSGMVTDAAVDLAEGGLLLGQPRAAYVAGTERVYRWADGQQIAARVEETHALPDATEPSLVTINLALEVDLAGQVNVESAGGRRISGFGGHPDFAMLGAVDPGGLSIVALPTQRGGRSTRVEHLSGPVSTPRFDVDVFVTENGSVDVRGMSDRERIEALDSLWAQTC